jgi:CheY-like chemotaxis protein/anti-sigma regulatory factor (Ser/Thr protein kinase)
MGSRKVESQIDGNLRLPGSHKEHYSRVSEFLSRGAYAIRSPVNIILGYSELIAQRLIALGDDSQRPYLEGIRRSGKQILEAINRILDYSSIEEGTLRLNPERIDLAALVEKLAQDYRVLSTAKKLGLICEITEPGARVRCDSYCLTNALSNLIDNAIKFTHKGGAVIKLCRDEQERLCIEVRDTGDGFDPEAMLRALEGSLDNGDQRYPQSGLGLILTRKYLDLIGASLTMSSSPGKGSVFTLFFSRSMEAQREPREAAGKVAATTVRTLAPARVDQTAPDPARQTIVVVEDQPDQALFLRALLQGKYAVVVAATAAQADAWLEELGERVGLVLMDVLLAGGEDGLSLTRRLRANRRWQDLQIVVITAHAFEEDRERALAAGCTAYLAKPIEAAELLDPSAA